METEIHYNVVCLDNRGPQFPSELVDFYYTQKEAIRNAKNREKRSAKRGFNNKYIVEKHTVRKTYIH